MTETLAAQSEGELVTVPVLRNALNELELRVTKLINEARNQTLLAIGLLILAQIGLHFWH
jgi:hypothetical protein